MKEDNKEPLLEEANRRLESAEKELRITRDIINRLTINLQKCTKCGRFISIHSNYCYNCGAKQKDGYTEASIGSIIKAMRKANKLTQTDIAIKIGTTSATISRYEQGTIQPNIDTLVKLAEIFQEDPSIFFHKENKGENE